MLHDHIACQHEQAKHLDEVVIDLFPPEPPQPALQEEWGITRHILRSWIAASGAKSTRDEITSFLSLEKFGGDMPINGDTQ